MGRGARRRCVLAVEGEGHLLSRDRRPLQERGPEQGRQRRPRGFVRTLRRSRPEARAAPRTLRPPHPLMLTKSEVHELIARRIRAWKTEDLEAITADYTPDVVHVSPHGHRVGIEVMREANARYLAEYGSFDVVL